MGLKKISSKVFLLALGLFLWGIGCSPSLFDDVVTTDNPATKKAPVFEDINQSEGSSTTAGNPGHGPSPTRDFHLNNLVYFPDDNDIVPVVGSAYGPFFPEGGQIVISEFALETSTEASKITSDISAIPADSDLCTEEGVVCCPVDEDFKYECYLPLVDRSLSEVFVGVMDAGFNVLSSRREPVQPNLLWLGQVPKDIQVAGTSLNNDGENQAGIGVLGDKRLLQVKEIGGQFKVLGEHAVEYEQVGGLSEDVPQIAFDDSGGLALRSENDGILLYTSSFVPLTGMERFEFIDSGNKVSGVDVDKYTILNRTFTTENWWGARKIDDGIEVDAFIYPTDWHPVLNPERIKIFDKNLNAGEFFKQTNTIDVGQYGSTKIGLAVSESHAGKNFLTLGFIDNFGSFKVEQMSEVVSDYDSLRFEISILENQAGISNIDSEKGTFALLDKKNRKVFIESFFADINNVGVGNLLTSHKTKYLDAGNDPIDMTFDANRNFVSILNSDSEVITYRVKFNSRLRSIDQIRLSKKVFKLDDYLTKPVLITPKKVTFHQSDAGSFLLVGIEDLKGMLTIKID